MSLLGKVNKEIKFKGIPSGFEEIDGFLMALLILTKSSNLLAVSKVLIAPIFSKPQQDLLRRSKAPFSLNLLDFRGLCRLRALSSALNKNFLGA